MYIQELGALERIARGMTKCPKCGAEKGEGGVVCWGECWRGEKGLKNCGIPTEEWLMENCPNLNL